MRPCGSPRVTAHRHSRQRGVHRADSCRVDGGRQPGHDSGWQHRAFEHGAVARRGGLRRCGRLLLLRSRHRRLRPASGACARSPLSYPPLWATEHHPTSFVFAACSGATTADVLSTQISSLQPTDDLVTITIGGNDVGFGSVLQTCTAAPSDDTCATAVDAAELS
ncbi:MAG TPA: GDSL-type esterase/lipase family protein [Pseudonocardiaceae bacterium]|nr:GDSL-type esterase/lipase family protein [Pseudonocardiaceae bacterium]